MTVPWRSMAARGALLAAALLPLVPAQSQYFGRNKVLWEQLTFEVLDTEHFSIYYYPPRFSAAPDAARLAERWYARLSPLLDHQLESRNPLIVYQDHADFQQTLTTSSLIGEGVGGFTESLQNRVVLPLTGVNADNDHVLGHELVHAFQFDMLRRPSGSSVESQPLPQWLAEGLAEYLSEGRADPQTAMWMRDAVLHDSLPDPENPQRLELSPYQYGQAIWAYVGGRWGDRVAVELFRHAATSGVDAAAQTVLGIDRRTLVEDFHASLRGAYRPILDARYAADELAEPLIDAEHGGGALNISPSLSPDGGHLAFLSSRELFTIELFLADAETGEVLERLVAAEGDPHFDSLSFVESSVAWSPDGRRLAFTAFAKGERQILIYDVDGRRVERALPLEGLKGVKNPSWSPDGRRLVFSAAAGGASDLYSVETDTGLLSRLTADGYTAIQPAFSPDGRKIVFVTDRGPRTDLEALVFGDLRLALLDVSTGGVEPLTIFERGKHIDPHFSADGAQLYFIAEPDGVPDVFRYDVARRESARLTALKTGVTGITAQSPALSIAAESGALAFSVLEDGRLNICRIDRERQIPPAEPAHPEEAAILPPRAAAPPQIVESYLEPALASEQAPATAAPFPRRAYDPRLELAYVGPATVGVSVDTYGTGAAGALSAYYTDTLGTRQLAATVYGGTSEGYLELEESLGGETAYINQERRVQWGAVVSRLPYLSSAAFVTRREVDVDGTPMPAYAVDNVLEVVTASELGVFTQYPLSLNRRVEASAAVSHLGYERRLERLVVPDFAPSYTETFDLPSPDSLRLQRAAIAYVTDNSYFGFLSPLRGKRFRLESEWTGGDLDFHTLLFDYRRYFFANPLSFAFRVLHVARRGDDAEDLRLSPLDVGTNQLVRGYELGSFDLSECTVVEGSSACPEYDRLIGSSIAVLNFELRIPLLGNRDFGMFRAPAFPTEAVVFVDVGAAWTEADDVDWRFDRDAADRVPVVSAGVAARMALGGVLPIQVFYAVPFQRPQQDAVFGVMISTGW